MPSANSAIEAVLMRDRAVVLVCLAVITALAWVYLFRMSPMGDMAGMEGMDGMAPAGFGAVFVMWAVMMVGMMVTPAAPMILVFATISRKRREASRPYVPTAVFAAGYLLVWIAVSFIAAAGQWQLSRAALLSPDLAVLSPLVSGGAFVVAGLYQFSPLKHKCLRHCRSPMEFVLFHWREGTGGAFRMGIEHGLVCLGCCWLLMALLFAVGIMNLGFVAALAALVLLEKAGPKGELVARVSGAVLVAAGLYVAAHGFV
jgi:predicted metal-binding membrane protein